MSTDPRYFSIERGVPRRRFAMWHPLLWILYQAAAFCVGLIISPLVLLIDIGRVGQRVGKTWVISFLITALVVSFLAWNSQHMLAEQHDKAVQLITDYSQIKGEIINGDEFPYFDLIQVYSIKRDLDPALVAAVVFRESRFDQYAISPAGARGLMQINPVTWRYVNPDTSCGGRHMPPECGDECIFHPEANIAVGTMYLRRLFDEFDGDVVLATAAYNAGPTAVRRYAGAVLGLGLPPYRETQRFVRDVIDTWLSYREDVVPVSVELDPARIKMLSDVNETLFRLSFGYWFLLLVWVLFKIPWKGLY